VKMFSLKDFIWTRETFIWWSACLYKTFRISQFTAYFNVSCGSCTLLAI